MDELELAEHQVAIANEWMTYVSEQGLVGSMEWQLCIEYMNRVTSEWLGALSRELKKKQATMLAQPDECESIAKAAVNARPWEDKDGGSW